MLSKNELKITEVSSKYFSRFVSALHTKQGIQEYTYAYPIEPEGLVCRHGKLCM